MLRMKNLPVPSCVWPSLCQTPPTQSQSPRIFTLGATQHSLHFVTFYGTCKIWMSVVSMVAVARRCDIIKVCTKVGLCWLEFRCWNNSLLLGEDLAWTQGVTLAWLSGCAHFTLRNLDGLLAAVPGGEPEARFLMGFQRVWGRGDPQQGWAAATLSQCQGGTAGILEHGRVGSLLRNWLNNSFWSLIHLQFEERFGF